ncbi:MAG: 30S ribosomal protein S6 [Bacillales bacterium]|nr:30S ribosomal protein S6 [Bacillales bacterium]
MKKYEVMYILKSNIDDANRNTLIGTLNDLLTTDGGTIENVNEWGLKDLAYEIKKEKKGYYVVVEANVASTAVIDEFDRRAKLNVNVLRHLIVAK